MDTPKSVVVLSVGLAFASAACSSGTRTDSDGQGGRAGVGGGSGAGGTAAGGSASGGTSGVGGGSGGTGATGGTGGSGGSSGAGGSGGVSTGGSAGAGGTSTGGVAGVGAGGTAGVGGMAGAAGTGGGTAGTAGTATGGSAGSGTGGSAGGSGCDACFSDTIAFRRDGGLVAFTEAYTLESCRTFTLERQDFTMPGSVETCSTTVRGCSDSSADAAEVLAALAHPDVAAALAEAPVLYGRDTRPVDGQVFVIEVGGVEIQVGAACAGSVGCASIPPGVAALRDVLSDLAAEQRAAPACASITM